MNALEEATIGALVAQKPARAALFDKLSIDFCCGGKATLSEACLKAGLAVEEVGRMLEEFDRCDSALTAAEEPDWLKASLTDLADHIVKTHHAYLNQELPRLAALVAKVAAVHGQKDARLLELKNVFEALKSELETHTGKEENILFPYIRSLDSRSFDAAAHKRQPVFGTVLNPVKCMENEHEDAGQALVKMRELTDQYRAPQGACNSWLALLDGLEKLDKDLRIHIHKENSILFPRAIASELSGK